ncbi:MAG: ATP-dependent DNA helicase RecG [Chloroflexota bacterium]|nr:ATP-dependent DNA helicase RecG [Chloroflexota bacterium]
MTDVDTLRAIIELERKEGYADKTVLGGLDRYLQRQASQIRQSLILTRNEVKKKDLIPQLLADFDELNLANYDYASHSMSDRKIWIASILQWLNRLAKAKQEGETPYSSQGELKSQESIDFGPQACNSKPEKATIKDNLLIQNRNGGLNSPITAISGITVKAAARLAKFGVKTIEDLLYFFPRRYVDYSQRKTISQLEEGKEQTIIASIWQTRIATFGNLRSTEAILADETGIIRAVWFNQPYLAKNFPANARIVVSGTVREFKGEKVFESPEWELIRDKAGSKSKLRAEDVAISDETIHTARLVPIYPLTYGLYPRQMRKWIKEVVNGYVGQVRDFLPPETKSRCQLIDLPHALTQIHYPDNQLIAENARERLAFDELFILQLGVLSRKRDWQESQPGNAFRIHQEIIDRFLSYLPFTLTQAQQKVLQEIIDDLQKSKAMSRLLQGEVGSGKTVVATLALLIAAANSCQGALMAPTEVLAEQHFRNIGSYLAKLADQEEKTPNIKCYSGFLPKPFTIALLVGSLSNSEKRNLHHRIKQGEIDIIVGTHALIQKGVEFNHLGLAIIDEQHRFGVSQRSALRQKGFNPHILVMTATPIPRTMALTFYGDLDISVIDELPPGRQTIKTKWLKPDYMEKAYSFIRREIGKDNQAFIICPLIEESESLATKAATTEYERLSHEVFPDLKLGLLHGQMPASEKEEAMRRFRAREFDILVSTSVVEVGIDIPRATVMLVEGAERFGLSQLHQFRGRVGRGKNQGYCILIPETYAAEIRERLHLMEVIHNGFALAEKDLELRGPGEFFGTQQSGLPNFKVAKLSNIHLLELARREAVALFDSDPDLGKSENSLLKERLNKIWSQTTEWS